MNVIIPMWFVCLLILYIIYNIIHNYYTIKIINDGLHNYIKDTAEKVIETKMQEMFAKEPKPKKSVKKEKAANA